MPATTRLQLAVPVAGQLLGATSTAKYLQVPVISSNEMFLMTLRVIAQVPYPLCWNFIYLPDRVVYERQTGDRRPSIGEASIKSCYSEDHFWKTRVLLTRVNLQVRFLIGHNITGIEIITNT